MNALVEYWDRETVIHPYIYCEERGDIVDDVLRRLDKAETDMSALRADVSKLQVDVGIIASNYATKTDIAEVKTLIANVRTELKDEISGLRTGLASMEGKIIKWFVATALASVGAAFSLAKLVH